MDLRAKFKAYIAVQHLFQPQDKLLLAISGGVDSAVLCYLCALCNLDFALAHCNFQLRGEESDRDEAFVKELALKYGVSLFTKRLDTLEYAKENKLSAEEAARNLRYNWFRELLEKNDRQFLLTAHHADDNIETVLMHFFRGSGIKGMRGILPKQGKIIRPLLLVRRAEIEKYASDNDIPFVTDSSNAENDFTRNYFRNELLPAIQKVFPAAPQNILDNIGRFKDIEQLYADNIAAIKKKIIERKGAEMHIPVRKLAKTIALSSVLYEIIKDFGFSAAQVSEAEKLLKAGSGKYIVSVTHRILRNRDWLIIAPLDNSAADDHFIIEKDETVIIFPKGKLQLKFDQAPAILDTGNDVAFINASNISYPLLLRKAKAGDYFYPLGMTKKSSGKTGKKKLSRFLADQKLSLTEKENIWVIESGKKIIWIAGYRMDDRFKITHPQQDALMLRLIPAAQKGSGA